MRLNITFRNLDATDALKQYASEKIDRVQRYLDRAGEAHIVLSLERHLHHADISIHAGTFLLRGREKSEDMYASIDLAMDKIERQLRRFKERIKAHKPSEARERQVQKSIVEAEGIEESKPVIIKTNNFSIKPMAVEEAVMQMELLHKDFLVYTDDSTETINVLYRRKDGNYGVIAPQNA